MNRSSPAKQRPRSEYVRFGGEQSPRVFADLDTMVPGVGRHLARGRMFADRNASTVATVLRRTPRSRRSRLETTFARVTTPPPSWMSTDTKVRSVNLANIEECD
jgi:hypothetical protein